MILDGELVEKTARAMYDALRREPHTIDGEDFGFQDSTDGKTILDGEYDLRSVTRAALEAALPVIGEKLAKVAENLGLSIVDLGEPEPGKMFSGVCTFDNQPDRKQMAEAIRSAASPLTR